MKNLWKTYYRLKLLNHQIIFKEAVSVDNALMIRNNQSFLSKIWNFTVFCDSSEWLTAHMIKAQWLPNRTPTSAVLNFNKNDADFFNFFTAIVNLCALMFSKNHSDLKFIFCLLLHFFCMFSSLYIVYFHRYIHHSFFHFFHQKLFRSLLSSLHKWDFITVLWHHLTSSEAENENHYCLHTYHSLLFKKNASLYHCRVHLNDEFTYW